MWLIYPHFEEGRGSVEPCLMARWKACVEFLLSVIELIFVSLTVEALEGKITRCFQEGIGHLEVGAKISGGGVVPQPMC